MTNISNKKSKQPLPYRSRLCRQLGISLLMTLVCLFAASQQAMATGWDKVYKVNNSVITPDNPFASYIVHIYNFNGKDSYLDSDLEVWIDGKKVGLFGVDFFQKSSIDLAIENGKVYSLNYKDCNNYGWEGIAIPMKHGDYDYAVNIYLANPNDTVGKSHSIYFRGKWVSDEGTGAWQNSSTYTINVGTKDDAWSTTTPNGIMYLDAENNVHYECDKYPQIPDGCSIDINIGTSYGSYTKAIKELGANVVSTAGEAITFSHVKKRCESQDYYLQNIIKKKDAVYPAKDIAFGDINFYVIPTTPITCKGFATPKNLTYEFDAETSTKSVILNWEVESDSRDTDGKWSIFRRESPEADLEHVANIEFGIQSQEVFTTKYDIDYIYYVCFLPKSYQEESYTKLLPDLYTILENAKTHNVYRVLKKEATCTESGHKTYWQCYECASIFADSKCTKSTTLADVTIAARGYHLFSSADKLHSICTACKHGFLHYKSKDKGIANTEAVFSTVNGEQNTIISNKNIDGEGVIEFEHPLGSIADYAFSNCSNLTGEIYIPHTVKKIGEKAFEGCNELKTIILNSLPNIAANSLEGKEVLMQLTDDSFIYTDMEQAMNLSSPATYTRNGVKNEWGTIVLPFDANGNDDCEFFTLVSVTDEELVLKTMKGTLPANTPVIFRLNSELVDGKTYDLSLNAANNNTIATLLDGASADGLTLTGNYAIKDICDEEGFFISNNAFWNIQTSKGSNKVWLSPFRAFLTGNASADMLSISINNDAEVEDNETAIEGINALTNGDAEYYDANGRRISTLQKGVNIVKLGNGKTRKVTIM